MNVTELKEKLKMWPRTIGMRSRTTTSISKTGAFSGEKW